MHELDQPLCKFAGKLMKLNNLINIGARNVTLKYDLIFPMPCLARRKARELGITCDIDGEWTRAKSFDTFGVFGPVITQKRDPDQGGGNRTDSQGSFPEVIHRNHSNKCSALLDAKIIPELVVRKFENDRVKHQSSKAMETFSILHWLLNEQQYEVFDRAVEWLERGRRSRVADLGPHIFPNT
jgi:hypothetical protein